MPKDYVFGEVYPNLSIRGDELMRRLENKSIVVPKEGKVYSTDPDVLAALRMDRTDLFRSHLKDTERIRGLKDEAKKVSGEIAADKAKAREEAIRAEAKAQAIAEHTKASQNGNG